MASVNGNAAIIERLVTAGADANTATPDGETVVRYLAAHGADISIWNRRNKQGWTPLRIAVGVHRGMHFRGSAPTADAVRELLAAAGLSTEVEPEPIISGAVK